MRKQVYLLRILLLLIISSLMVTPSFSSEGDVEITLDINSSTVALPKIFKAGIDVSGRGIPNTNDWPQNLAGSEAMDVWQKDIGFGGMYRIQFNLWEITAAGKDKARQDKLLGNYEGFLKKVTDSGGVALVNLFGMPAGLGRVLDKKSPVADYKAFKQEVKKYMRYLSYEKRYNIWYEVWSAPDLDDFFLGRKQDYFNIYKAVAEAVIELENETKVHIPLGGPAVSWWFQDMDGNTIRTPEHSLIYGLIRFCSRYRLPLNFISWHAYSTDPKVEKAPTIYAGKGAIPLIRDWLSYFNFSKDIPLIVSEWNYDSGANFIEERQEKSHISASYIPSRIKNMSEAGLDYQLYFGLEDFNNVKEGIIRNVGIFEFSPQLKDAKPAAKLTYNVFRMLSALGEEVFTLPKNNDEFIGAIATADKKKENIKIIIYNYIDPNIAYNYLSRTIGELPEGERKLLLNFAKTDKLEKLLAGEIQLPDLRLRGKLKTVLRKAVDLQEQARGVRTSLRQIRLKMKNLNQNYLYQRYIVDSSAKPESAFTPAEEKELLAPNEYSESFALPAYSLEMLVFKKLVKDIPIEKDGLPPKEDKKE